MTGKRAFKQRMNAAQPAHRSISKSEKRRKAELHMVCVGRRAEDDLEVVQQLEVVGVSQPRALSAQEDQKQLAHMRIEVKPSIVYDRQVMAETAGAKLAKQSAERAASHAPGAPTAGVHHVGYRHSPASMADEADEVRGIASGLGGAACVHGIGSVAFAGAGAAGARRLLARAFVELHRLPVQAVEFWLRL